jgi:UDP-glucose 4-epimerase
MKILITGGAGFIGSHLADLLIENGHYVSIIDDLSTGNLENLNQIIKSKLLTVHIDNIINCDVLQNEIKNSDWVFHLAAAVGVKTIIEKPLDSIVRNVRGTEIVFKLCSQYHKKIYFASSSEVYGKQNIVPFGESGDLILGSPEKLRWSYAASKLIDEFHGLSFYREKNLPIVIGRHFNTVGPRQSSRYGMVIPNFIKQANSGIPLTVFGDGSQSRTFMDVREVVKIMCDLMESKKTIGEIVNIGSKFEISIRDLANLVIKITNSSSTITFIPYKDVYSADFEDMARRVPSISKLSKFLSLPPANSLPNIIRDINVTSKEK